MSTVSSSETAAAAPGFAAGLRMPWALLAAAALGSFAATASGSVRSPFLIDMARDLGTSLPVIGNLFALTAVAWGVTSFLAGIGADRWGRRPFLIGGPIALGGALVGVASGVDLLSVAAWASLAGGCAGIFTSAIFAEVATRVSDQSRGRALGWVMSGQSLTLVIGVPLAAWVGSAIGWRGVHVCVAGLAFAAALAFMLTARPAAPASRQAAAPPVSMRSALSGPVLRILAMVVAERICFGLAAVYYATFLQSAYALSLEGTAVPLIIVALGNVIGTIVGGHIADRWRNRLRTFAAAMLASAAAAIVLFAWLPGLATSVMLGFVYVFLNALGRPALMAALADVPDHVRGTVMGLNGTCASVGWIGAAALGSWMIASYGFAAFGPLIAVLAVLAVLLTRFRRA
jgi:DHA1 family inner membrane transport protein